MTDLAICADDFGQGAAIDDAICALLDMGRLTAVSCLATPARWPEAAPRLRDADADIGLHLDLTSDASLLALIVRSVAHTLDLDAVRVRFERQCDAFEAALGRAPDFIDGHQHVHQFPGVRAVFLALLKRRYGERPPWVRNTLPPGPGEFKQAILRWLGGAALANGLTARGIGTNNGFLGVYGFEGEYGPQVARWLAQARNGSLLMCHPATAADAADPIGSQRMEEYGFLQSDAFSSMLAERHIRLVRLSTILPPR